MENEIPETLEPEMIQNGLLAVLAASVLITPMASLHAQAEPLEAGRSVRLFLYDGPDPVEGTLFSVTPTEWSVSLADGGARTLSPESVARAEVLGQKRKTMKGALIGGAAGLALGVMAVATAEDDCEGDPTGFCDAIGSSLDGFVLAGSPLLGAGMGALVGAFVKSDRWVPAFIPDASPAGRSCALSWSIPVG